MPPISAFSRNRHARVLALGTALTLAGGVSAMAQQQETAPGPAPAQQEATPAQESAAGAQPAPQGQQTPPGQPTPTLVEDFEDWRVLCEDETQETRNCTMQQEQTREGNQSLLTMQVNRAPDGEASSARLLLPFGIVFGEGVRVSIDDNESLGAVAVNTCLPSGCISEFPLNQQALTQMRGGLDLSFEVTAINGETMTLPISLSGFTAAYERLGELAQS